KWGVVEIYANYSDYNKLVYDLNGGSVKNGTVNMSGNAHSTVELDGNRVSATYSDEYLSFFECGSSFWDDGSFYKTGAILTEYNTRPDGSGTSYSLGSKVPLTTDGEQTVLYCIWATETPENLFDVSEVSMINPATKESYAPDWKESGVIITAYYGNADTVVIPESINGSPVIGIGAGAFNGCEMTTLVMGNNIQKIEDGAFKKCTSLSTVYYPDGIYYISNEAFDEATTAAIKHLYVNATIAPRYSGADVGGLAVKMSRLLAPTTLPRIIVIAGSSSYQGLGTEYMEALFGGKYRVVNFGTTRTTHGFMYLEAMGALAGENDTVLYAPENSSYMFGERELYFKILRDLEGMNNIYRYVDISGYTNVFSAFAELNEYRYTMSPIAYESVCERARESEYDKNRGVINKYGDYLKLDRSGRGSTYYDSYHITLNEYVKSKNEGAWNDVGAQQNNSNYLDPNNNTWCKITDAYYADSMNRVINIAKSGGAKVYFSFCPVEGAKLVDGANTEAWLAAYDKLILDIYDFDDNVGSCSDYIFASEYFYDNAFHLNDYGRTYRTYQLYLDLCTILGISEPKDQYGVGTLFDGCLFDGGSVDSPKYSVTLNP
ncbi:MAG: leucine-rich repeat protein, partial [Clostridia bacterium]|nr:leucine-rich repeat protein [Clostridia bacterium]